MIYEISYKTLIDPVTLSIKFDKIDGFIRIYDRTRYLTLLDFEKYDVIYDKVGYLISLKSGMTYIFSHYFAELKVDSYDYLPKQVILTLHHVITLIRSVLCTDKNHYYYEKFLKKKNACINYLKINYKFFS